ncbi:MAG: hypothetical protein KC800_18525, partial [Candidatus Eremiobacteraeota bacterium]|nr:hypothetical protein [Candidatus Eremiobacteraeota bacterium]
LVTNSKAVLDEVLAKLSPSWKPTRSAASEPLQVELREVFTAEGFAYNLNIDGSGFHYPIISEALDQLEIQVLLRGVLKSKTYLHLATSYSLTDRRGARISLSASDRASVCLLDKDFQVVPYATSGRQVEHSTPVPVQEIEVEGQASKALLVSLLVQRCQNVDAVENPLRYFAKLIDSVERVPVGGR